MTKTTLREHWLRLRHCFALYSRLPQKNLAWSEEHRASLLLYFPLVGGAKFALIVSSFLLALRLIASLGFLDLALRAEAQLLTAIGICYNLHAFSGFMHLDGYLDWHDARASNQGRELKLEIMADPHLGAFAVMRAIFYLISEIALIFVLLRELVGPLSWLATFNVPGGHPIASTATALLVYLLLGLWLGCVGATLYSFSGKLIYQLPAAKASGMAQMLQDGARLNFARRLTWQSFFYWTLFLIPFFDFPFRPRALKLILLLLGILGLYLFEQFKRAQIMRLYGGITGDICGHYLMQMEFSTLLFFVIILSF